MQFAMNESQYAFSQQTSDRQYTFELRQRLEKARLRLDERRATMVDNLLRVMFIGNSIEDYVVDDYLVDVFTLINRYKNAKDMQLYLEECRQIKSYLQPSDVPMWEQILVLVEDYARKMQFTENRPDAKRMYNVKFIHLTSFAFDQQTFVSIPKLVLADVHQIFSDMQLTELQECQRSIDSYPRSEYDKEYWTIVSQICKVFVAKAMLEMEYERTLERVIEFYEDDGQVEQSRSTKYIDLLYQLKSGESQEAEAQQQQDDDTSAKILVHEKQTLTPHESYKKNLLRREQRHSAYNQENILSHLTVSDLGECVWRELGHLHDSEQSQIPEYYCKAVTGYVWTSYNRAKYSFDNPPPKLIQGYKFNIFFPDLIGSGRKPSFRLIDCPPSAQPMGNSDKTLEQSSKLIVFSCDGHVYRDIVFRIVNREWETSPRSGFKSVFQHGILTLYFVFKRASGRLLRQ
ncbi:hypothetical protein MP228_011502 [Amoeboaphelidium protococcarum]|nr:hypothetical protein MP228_011502 [Amoeboaphelidium protococcarum]